jgi:hypothetical protein
MINVDTPLDIDKAGYIALQIRALKQDILDMFAGGLLPVGYVYTQYPDTKSPEELGLQGTWEIMNFAGAFFRSEGGLAQDFDTQVAQQADTTAVKGLSVVTAGAHQHGYVRLIQDVPYEGGNYGDWGNMSYYTRNTDPAGGHSHTLTGDAETRPVNYTVRKWRRTA